jgi:hypothetical protein
MKGKIYGVYVKGEDGTTHRITKHETRKFENDTEVEYELDNEYPESCDSFCDGDETCIICYHENVVAKIKK